MFSLRKWWTRSHTVSSKGQYSRLGFEQLGGGSWTSPQRSVAWSRPQVERLEERIVPSFATGGISAVWSADGAVGFVLSSVSSGGDLWAFSANAQRWFQLTSGVGIQQITAGLDRYNQPVVYALTTAGNVWQGDPLGYYAGWTELGGGGAFTSITGAINDTVFALDAGGNVWRLRLDNRGPASQGFPPPTSNTVLLGTSTEIKQISAGCDGANNYLCVLLNDGNVFGAYQLDQAQNPLSVTWNDFHTGGGARAITGGNHDGGLCSVFAIGFDHNVYWRALSALGLTDWVQEYNLGNADDIAVGMSGATPELYVNDDIGDLSVVQDIFHGQMVFQISKGNEVGDIAGLVNPVNSISGTVFFSSCCSAPEASDPFSLTDIGQETQLASGGNVFAQDTISEF